MLPTASEGLLRAAPGATDVLRCPRTGRVGTRDDFDALAAYLATLTCPCCVAPRLAFATEPVVLDPDVVAVARYVGRRGLVAGVADVRLAQRLGEELAPQGEVRASSLGVAVGGHDATVTR
jgi:hypothetical protein